MKNIIYESNWTPGPRGGRETGLLCDDFKPGFPVTGPSSSLWPSGFGKETWSEERPMVHKGGKIRGHWVSESGEPALFPGRYYKWSSSVIYDSNS